MLCTVFMKIIHTFSKCLLARGCHGEIAGFQDFLLGEGNYCAVGGHATQIGDF